MRIHIIEKNITPHKEWFYDFIEKYLRTINEKYYTQRSILWKIVRNESAHAMFAQSAIVWSNAEWIKNYHMLGANDPRNSKKSLLLWTSKFVQDIDASVSIFFNDVKNNEKLSENCQKSFLDIYEYGQKIINEEIDEGILKINIEAEVNPG
jgi:RNAse (barnase) inhibitor barstar